MAYTASTFRCWQFKQRRKCQWCRRPIELRTTDQKRVFAFEPNPPVLRVEEHPVTLVKFDILEPTALHSRVCPKRNERAAAGRKQKRQAARFAVQGKLI